MDKIKVKTGGSCVYNGRWSSDDHRYLVNDKYPTDLQKSIEKNFGTYLLARGKAYDRFGFFRYKDHLIIQSRISWDDQPREGMLFANLLGALVRYPNLKLTVKSPWKVGQPYSKDEIKQKLKAIRRRIYNHMRTLATDDERITKPNDRLLFTI